MPHLSWNPKQHQNIFTNHTTDPNKKYLTQRTSENQLLGAHLKGIQGAALTQLLFKYLLILKTFSLYSLNKKQCIWGPFGGIFGVWHPMPNCFKHCSIFLFHARKKKQAISDTDFQKKANRGVLIILLT